MNLSCTKDVRSEKRSENCNAERPDAHLVLQAFRHYVEITDWSGAATSPLGSGDALTTLMGNKNAEQTDRVAQRKPGALLFQTQTSIRVEISEHTYGDGPRRTRARFTAARQRDFSQDLGEIYSTRSNQIELTNNISHAFLKDATYQNGQLAIAQDPTNSRSSRNWM